MGSLSSNNSSRISHAWAHVNDSKKAKKYKETCLETEKSRKVDKIRADNERTRKGIEQRVA
jgi:hypothetical protein